jgi:hypothetical protein
MHLIILLAASLSLLVVGLHQLQLLHGCLLGPMGMPAVQCSADLRCNVPWHGLDPCMELGFGYASSNVPMSAVLLAGVAVHCSGQVTQM